VLPRNVMGRGLSQAWAQGRTPPVAKQVKAQRCTGLINAHRYGRVMFLLGYSTPGLPYRRHVYRAIARVPPLTGAGQPVLP
jgi:hypothetical protein